jgi:dihydrofolate synthase/folylpolyglutamate synthase
MKRSLADWLDYIEHQHPKQIALGLDRVREVAVRMQLDKPAKQVITVGGTNGKGSTVAFIESIARAAGWKTGAYTSPHLLRYNERVRIDGVEVSDEQLVEAFEVVETARLSPSPNGRGVGVRGNEGQNSSNITDYVCPSSGAARHLLPLGEGNSEIPLTYFEYGTLAALWLFQRANLDLAILEVGLGGRLDAVNIVDADVAVITTVDIDHTDLLGHDRESIGYEKAGIARAWKPLVLGEVDSPSSVLRHAYNIGANALRLGSDFFAEPLDATHWRWREVGVELELPNPELPAPAQRNNAAAAIAALRALPISPPDSAFAQGIADTKLPGRLQHFQRNGVDVFVDVGHNPQAARELAAWLALQPRNSRNFAVYAALADKDAAQVIDAFGDAVTCWFLAGIDDAGPRSQNVDALAAKLVDTSAADGERHANVTQALDAALAQAQAGDCVLVFGSFHTAAAALEYRKHSGQ